jgi:hypothetical protein
MKIGLTEARIQVSADTPTFIIRFSFSLPLSVSLSLHPSRLAFFFCSAGYHSVTHRESDKANSFLTLLSRFYAMRFVSLLSLSLKASIEFLIPSFAHSANTAIIELTHASVIIRQQHRPTDCCAAAITALCYYNFSRGRPRQGSAHTLTQVDIGAQQERIIESFSAFSLFFFSALLSNLGARC